MPVLAIDSASPRPALALVTTSGPALLEELPVGRTERLAIQVQDLLKKAGETPRALKRVAVVSGPGSFTGLRSGIAFARGLARAVRASLVLVPTFEAASRARTLSSKPSDPLADVDLVLDALRGDVHRARRRGGVVLNLALLPRAAAIAEAERDGVFLYDLNAEKPLLVPAAAGWLPDVDPATQAEGPVYGRPSAAEEAFLPWALP